MQILSSGFPPSLNPSLPRTHLHHVQGVQGEILLEAGGGRHLPGLHLQREGAEGRESGSERRYQSWSHWRESERGGGEVDKREHVYTRSFTCPISSVSYYIHILSPYKTLPPSLPPSASPSQNSSPLGERGPPPPSRPETSRGGKRRRVRESASESASK